MCAHELHFGRRRFVEGLAAVAAGALGLIPRLASGASESASLAARLPTGFSPFNRPGKVVKVSGKGDFPSLMQTNQLWPKAEVARRLLERAMMELTGAANLTEAMKCIVCPSDIVAIKPNGIAGSSMATSYELILPVVEACLAAGVKPEQITVYEQFPTYLLASRVGASKYPLPSSVKTASHNNKDLGTPSIRVFEGITTHYCRQLIDATCVINMGLVKDHSICGYTGALKNITHGTINNPEAHHAHYANPQIAMLYAQPVVTSRARLHIADAFRLMHDKGPLLKDPSSVVPHGSVYVSTDPVALDTVGWMAVDEERKKRRRPDLAAAGRAPRYIETAADLGLGVRDLNQLRLVSIEG